jgi:hypothetical protein
VRLAAFRHGADLGFRALVGKDVQQIQSIVAFGRLYRLEAKVEHGRVDAAIALGRRPQILPCGAQSHLTGVSARIGLASSNVPTSGHAITAGLDRAISGGRLARAVAAGGKASYQGHGDQLRPDSVRHVNNKSKGDANWQEGIPCASMRHRRPPASARLPT